MRNSLLYTISRPFVCFLFKILYRPKFFGVENIPIEGKIILAGNHTNNFDCLMLMSSTKREVHFLAKAELWKGLKGLIFSHMGLIPVYRNGKDHKALIAAEEYLKNDRLIGIFPEGTFSKTNDLLPFKIGAVKMACDTDTMIVPFAITGHYNIFSNDLKIIFDKPISIKKENLEVENDKLRKKVIELKRK